MIDSLFPETGEAVVEVLNRAGYQVHFKNAQTCCGQPAYNAGYWEDARKMAKRTMQVFAGSDEPVIIPSGSCAHMIRHGYPELFQNDPKLLKEANSLAKRTYELSEFLIDCSGWSPTSQPSRGHSAYHPSCHLLRGLGVHDQPLKLLSAAGFNELVELSPECCGFGGVFAIDHAVISNEMLQRRLHEIESQRVSCVIGCDVSCLMNIEGALRRAGSPVRCSHIASVLTSRDPGLR